MSPSHALIADCFECMHVGGRAALIALGLRRRCRCFAVPKGCCVGVVWEVGSRLPSSTWLIAVPVPHLDRTLTEVFGMLSLAGGRNLFTNQPMRGPSSHFRHGQPQVLEVDTDFPTRHFSGRCHIYHQLPQGSSVLVVRVRDDNRLYAPHSLHCDILGWQHHKTPRSGAPGSDRWPLLRWGLAIIRQLLCLSTSMAADQDPGRRGRNGEEEMDDIFANTDISFEADGREPLQTEIWIHHGPHRATEPATR